MWIICCGMPRSGSTVQYQLTKEIVENNGNGKAIGFVRKSEYKELYHKYNGQCKNIVIKSHRFIPDAVPLFEEGNAKAIYVYRDIRDAVLSRIKKRNITFKCSEALELVQLNLGTYYQWQYVSPILISKYEDMVADLKSEALRIGQHLEIEVSEEYASELERKYSIEQQKKRIASFNYEIKGVKQKRWNAHYDKETQLHSNHIRSGKTEQWKTDLSSMQVALIEERAYDWLMAQGYLVSQSWLKRKSSAIILTVQEKLNMVHW